MRRDKSRSSRLAARTMSYPCRVDAGARPWRIRYLMVDSRGDPDMTAPKKRRQRLFTDRQLQGTLLAHTAIYWFYCLFSVTLIAVCWIVFTQQPDSSSDLFNQLWLSCGPALLGSVLLLPLVLLDCLRLTSRFAGPMVRFQRAMRELAREGATAEVKLRDGDYWREFADDFNIVVKKLQGETPAATMDSAAAAEASQSADSLAATVDYEPPQQPKSAPLPEVLPLDGEATPQDIYSNLSI